MSRFASVHVFKHHVTLFFSFGESYCDFFAQDALATGRRPCVTYPLLYTILSRRTCNSRCLSLQSPHAWARPPRRERDLVSFHRHIGAVATQQPPRCPSPPPVGDRSQAHWKMHGSVGESRVPTFSHQVQTSVRERRAPAPLLHATLITLTRSRAIPIYPWEPHLALDICERLGIVD